MPLRIESIGQTEIARWELSDGERLTLYVDHFEGETEPPDVQWEWSWGDHGRHNIQVMAQEDALVLLIQKALTTKKGAGEV